MPTDAVSLPPADLSMRFKEPYLTAGLNTKALVIPRGIYRGFDVIPSGVALTVTIVAALPKNDHLATVETQNNYTLTIHRTVGNFDVSLAAYVGQSVILALYCAYALNTPTIGILRIYTAAEYAALTVAQQNELTILASVVVPGAGLIPAGNISYALRTLPANTASPNAVLWPNVIRNGSFELGAAIQEDWSVPNWYVVSDTAPSAYFVRLIPADTGLRGLSWFHEAAGTWDSVARQFLGIPVLAGQRFRLTFRLQRLILPTSVTLGEAQINFRDANGVLVAGPTLSLNLTGAVDGSFQSLEIAGVVPAGVTSIRDVAFVGIGVNYGVALSTLFAIDAVTLLMQPMPGFDVPDAAGGIEGYAAVGALALTARGGMTAYDGPQVLFQYDSLLGPTEGSVTARVPYGGLPPQLRWESSVRVGDALLSTPTDRLESRIRTFYSGVTLLHESQESGAGGPAYRLYMNGSSSMWVTYNAYFDGTNFTKDQVGVGAFLLELAGGEYTVKHRPAATGGTWSVTGWVTKTAVKETADFALYKTAGNGAASVTKALEFVPDFSISADIGEYVEGYVLSATDFLRRVITFNGKWNTGTSTYAITSALPAPILQQILDHTGWTFRTGSLDVGGGVYESVPFAATLARHVRVAPIPYKTGAVFPAVVDPGTAVITQLNVPKSMAHFVTGGPLIIKHAFGIATAVYSGSSIQVTYATALLPPGEVDAIINATLNLNTGLQHDNKVVVSAKTNTTFDLTVYDGAGAVVNLSTTLRYISFVEYGYHS